MTDFDTSAYARHLADLRWAKATADERRIQGEKLRAGKERARAARQKWLDQQEGDHDDD